MTGKHGGQQEAGGVAGALMPWLASGGERHREPRGTPDAGQLKISAELVHL